MILVDNAQTHNGMLLMRAYGCLPVFTPRKQQFGGDISVNHAAVSSSGFLCLKILNGGIIGLTTRMPDFERNSMPVNCGINTDVT